MLFSHNSDLIAHYLQLLLLLEILLVDFSLVFVLHSSCCFRATSFSVGSRGWVWGSMGSLFLF